MGSSQLGPASPGPLYLAQLGQSLVASLSSPDPPTSNRDHSAQLGPLARHASLSPAAQSFPLGPSVSHSSVLVTNVLPMQTRSKSSISKPKNILSLTTHMSESKPTSFKEAISHPKRKAAMIDEFNALIF